MKKQAMNPFLPLDAYIPDGEPHVFGDRLYLFGSHDSEGGERYCAEEDYVGWSAPVDDLSDWRCEGIIYEAKQDPGFREGQHNDLYAPDVVRGNDGRYYLYYCFGGEDGHNKVNVAVCDTPAGRYEYLGFVRNPDGTPHCEYLMGDPAVLNDGGVIRLYCGWSLSMVAAGAHQQGRGYDGEAGRSPNQTQGMGLPKPGDPLMNVKLSPLYKMLFHRSLEQVRDLEYPLMGANTIELCDDMLTVKGKPRRIVPGQFDTPEDSGFYGHAFYEASSIRKINGVYYFIYSSENSQELCYAVSRYPDRDFEYGGVIISNGDVGYKGRDGGDRLNMTANNHGSLECVNGQWYIFYHRQTHRSTFSRQACAEPVTIAPDGSIAQVECTSCGLNGSPLKPEGRYSAAYACNLTNGHMPHATNTTVDADIPYITHGDGERYITAVRNGTLIGFKYFNFAGRVRLTVRTRGEGTGVFRVSTDEAGENQVLGELPVSPSDTWQEAEAELDVHGVLPLYLRFEGDGSTELLDIAFD